MKAAMVAVPTLITAEILIPASTDGSASGNSIKRITAPGRNPSARPACRILGAMPANPLSVLRTMGSRP